MSKNQNAAKTWVFTLNNYDEKDEQLFQRFAGDTEMVTRMVVAREVGETGTPHLQGAVSWKRSKRLAACKKLHPRAHWEKAIAQQEAFEYCRKADSDVFIDVDNRRQGKRTDLDEAIASIEQGISTRDLWLTHPKQMIRYSKGLLQFKKIHDAGNSVGEQYPLDSFNTDPLDIGWGRSYICYGDSGVGKTCFAKAHFQRPLFVTHLDTLRNFQPGYHDGIVFDDMSFTHLPRETQIHLVDQAQERQIHCRYETAIIPAGTPRIFTTNIDGGFIFDLNDPAIARRIALFAAGNLVDAPSDEERHPSRRLANGSDSD